MFGMRHSCGSHGGVNGPRAAAGEVITDPGQGWGGRHGGMGGGEMMRAGRMLAQGDLRLIALALIAEQPRHGYEIIKVLEDKTAGWYSPSPGIVYPTLTYLEEVGYLTAQPEGAKRLYTITAGGPRASRGEPRLRRRRARAPWRHGRTRDPHAPPRPKRGRRTPRPERLADGARGDREPARHCGQAARRRRRGGSQGGRGTGRRRVAVASHVTDSGVDHAMSTLDSPAVAGLLKQLFARADHDDPVTFERVNVALKRLPQPPDQRQRAELMRDVYMPVSPDVGRLLYVLGAQPRGQGHCRVRDLVRHFRHPSGGGGAGRRRQPCRRHRARPDQGRARRAELPSRRALRARRPSRRRCVRRRSNQAWAAASICFCSTAGRKRTCPCCVCWSRSSPRARWSWPTISISRRRRLPLPRLCAPAGQRIRLGRAAARRSHRDIAAHLSVRRCALLIPP